MGPITRVNVSLNNLRGANRLKSVYGNMLFEKKYVSRQRCYVIEILPEAKTLKSAVKEVRSGDTTNREAQAARIYFQSLFGPGFCRDIDCTVNDALNYGYAILLSTVNRGIVSRGYVTQCGICHRSEYNQFNLACDLMESFRPLVDRMVDEWVGSEFDSNARHMLGDFVNQTVSYQDGAYKVGSVISLYVQDCLNALNKKIAIDDISGYEVA